MITLMEYLPPYPENCHGICPVCKKATTWQITKRVIQEQFIPPEGSNYPFIYEDTIQCQACFKFSENGLYPNRGPVREGT
jgi:hypothetical protein